MNIEIVIQCILGFFIILSAFGIILARKPVHACLSFLATLLLLSAYYLELSAQFIGIMQILVYAGAILVIFMFVIVLFQDAYLKIAHLKSNTSSLLLAFSGIMLLFGFTYLAFQLKELPQWNKPLPDNFGSVQNIGKALYVDFFFPFEAIIMVFLVAIVGAVYIGKREH